MDLVTYSGNQINRTGAHKRYLRLISFFESKYLKKIIYIPIFNIKFNRFLFDGFKNNECYLLIFSYKRIALSLILFLFYKKVHIICFIRQDPILYEPYITNSIFEKSLSFLSSLLIKLQLVTIQIVAQTKFDSKSIVKRYPLIKSCHVIPNNIIIKSKELKDWLKISRKNIITKSKFNLIFVGDSSNLRKNFNLINQYINHLGKMKSAKDISSFTLVGKYSNFQLVNLKEILNKKNISLTYIHRYKNIDEILKKNSIILHTAFVDSFPNLLIESIEKFIPFISSNIAIANSIIKDKNLLFNPNILESFDESLHYLIKLISSDIEKEIFSEYSKKLNFDWEKKVERFIKSKIKYS